MSDEIIDLTETLKLSSNQDGSSPNSFKLEEIRNFPQLRIDKITTQDDNQNAKTARISLNLRGTDYENPANDGQAPNYLNQFNSVKNALLPVDDTSSSQLFDLTVNNDFKHLSQQQSTELLAAPVLQSVVILGARGVGKSSLFRCLQSKYQKSRQAPSQRTRFCLVAYKQHKFQLFDTPGDEESEYLNIAACLRADLAIIVFSCEARESFQKAQFYREKVAALNKECNFYLVCNKNDIMEHYAFEEDAASYAVAHKLQLSSISCVELFDRTCFLEQMIRLCKGDNQRLKNTQAYLEGIEKQRIQQKYAAVEQAGQQAAQ